MKNKKLLIIIAVFVTILEIGAVVAFLGGIFNNDTYTVRIDYVIDGADKPFKIFTEEYAPGSTANIVAPALYGYQPRQASFVAIVNSDYVVTVVYDCTHVVGMDKSTIISYPTETDDGVMEYTCETCGEFIHTTFTKLSRTIYFGGADYEVYLRNGTKTGYTANDWDNCITLKQSYVPEWKVFYDYGLEFGNNAWLPENCDVEYEYDESVWGIDAVGFTRAKQDLYDEPYRFRIASGSTIAIMFESNSGTFDWDLFKDPDNCPLVRAPIKVTLSYDWRK